MSLLKFSFYRAGRDSYGDSAIGYVQVKRLHPQCTVKARVTPEHKVRATAYHCTFVCDEVANKIENLECEGCAASKGGCEHTIALVMWLHRRSEEPACTEVTCYWMKPKLSQVGSHLKFIKAKDMGNTRQPRSSTAPLTPNNTPDERFLQSVIKKSMEMGVDSQIMTYFHPTADVDKVSIHNLVIQFRKENSAKDAERFITFCKENIRSQQCDAIENATRSQADCKLWHEMRYARITPSKAYESAKCSTPDGVLVETILGAYKFKETFAIKRGS